MKGLGLVVGRGMERMHRHLGQLFSILSVYQSHLEGLLKHRVLGATSRVSDLVSQTSAWGGGSNFEFRLLALM